MIKFKIENPCRKIRRRLRDVITHKVTARGGWVEKHIAKCPRCRARLRMVDRVEFALSLVKAQPHSAQLFMKANIKALNVLNHSLRDAPKAEKLKIAQRQQSWQQKTGVHLIPLSKTAACLGVILFLKMGILTSMDNFRRQGDNAVKHHYAKYLDQEYADEIFSA